MSVLHYIGLFLAYTLIGVGWGFLRWKRHVDNEVQFYDRERQRFLNHHRIRGTQIPDFLVFEWRRYVDGNERLKEVPPKAHDNQGQIGFDVALWPISFLLVVLVQAGSVVLQIVLREYNKVTEKKIDQINQDLKG